MVVHCYLHPASTFLKMNGVIIPRIWFHTRGVICRRPVKRRRFKKYKFIVESLAGAVVSVNSKNVT